MSWQAVQAVQDHSSLSSQNDWGGLLVMLAIARYCDATGKTGDSRSTSPTIETISKASRCSRRTVLNWLPKLEAIGELSVDRNGSGRGGWNTYTINLPIYGAANGESYGVTSVHHNDNNGATNGEVSVHHNNECADNGATSMHHNSDNGASEVESRLDRMEKMLEGVLVMVQHLPGYGATIDALESNKRIKEKEKKEEEATAHAVAASTPNFSSPNFANRHPNLAARNNGNAQSQGTAGIDDLFPRNSAPEPAQETQQVEIPQENIPPEVELVRKWTAYICDTPPSSILEDGYIVPARELIAQFGDVDAILEALKEEHAIMTKNHMTPKRIRVLSSRAANRLRSQLPPAKPKIDPATDPNNQFRPRIRQHATHQ